MYKYKTKVDATESCKRSSLLRPRQVLQYRPLVEFTCIFYDMLKLSAQIVWAVLTTTYFIVIYKRIQKARVFVPGKLFQPSLMFVAKGWSLPKSSSLGQAVALDQAGKAFQKQILKPIRPINKLSRKQRVLNTAPGTVLTTLHFLLNLQKGPISYSVTLRQTKRLSSDKHSSLMGAFISYKKMKCFEDSPKKQQQLL